MIADDGVGFDPGTVLFESGIAVMRSFAVLGQGTLAIDSAPGRDAGDGTARGRRRCADAPGGPGPDDPGGDEVAGAGRKPSRACGCWWAAAARWVQSVKREVAYSGDPPRRLGVDLTGDAELDVGQREAQHARAGGDHVVGRQAGAGHEVASSDAICTRVAMADASTASSWVTHGSRKSSR